MEQQNYTCSITANTTPAEAFEGITRVSGWWATNVRGSCNRLNDIFTVHVFAVTANADVVKTFWGAYQEGQWVRSRSSRESAKLG